MKILFKYLLCIGVITNMSCQNSLDSNLIVKADLSKLLKECSGIENITGSDNFWLINDAGNTNELFEVNDAGKILNVVEVENAKNKDWEDLASDGKDRIFIGDFGNNENDRKKLKIYTIAVSEISNNSVQASKVSFHFEDQDAFPPKKKKRNFDVEAFVYMKGYFYLFTKDRSTPFKGITKLYKLKASTGKHTAKLLGQYTIGKDLKTSQVTGAAISNDYKKLVLLTHDKVLEFSGYNGDDFFNGSLRIINLNHFSQKESICFKGNDVYITDENSKYADGNLYQLKLTQ